MHKKATITHKTPQEAIGIKIANLEQSFPFDNLFLISEIWMMGVTKREDA